MSEFVEKLPDQCPPADASDCEWKNVYRLLEKENPDKEAFKSHAALGKTPPANMDLCRWASCSLVLDPKKIKKLPNFKNHRWAAKINVPVGAGRSKKSGINHVDFWCGKEFDIASFITEIVSL